MAFRRDKPYNRSDILAEAARAEAKGRTKRALAEYRKVLAKEPGNHTIRGKIAPLQAARKEYDAAWSNFHAAAQGYRQEGFVDKSISLYRQAAGFFPHKVMIWETLADLQLQRGYRADAVQALLEGARKFRSRPRRETAIRLLAKAHALAPDDTTTTVRLGRLLCRAGRREEGIALLDRLAEQEARRDDREGLKKVRALLFLLRPTPVRAWHWVRATVSGE